MSERASRSSRTNAAATASAAQSGPQRRASGNGKGPSGLPVALQSGEASGPWKFRCPSCDRTHVRGAAAPRSGLHGVPRAERRIWIAASCAAALAERPPNSVRHESC